MQTFLPYASYADSAKALDYRRLGKQRVEAWQILNVLYAESMVAGVKRGWQHHPAVRMWKGSERALCVYGIMICEEWIRRGYKDTMRERFVSQLQCFAGRITPPWFGSDDFHRAHQSNLVRKDPKFYGPLFPSVPDNLPYVWPIQMELSDASNS